MTAFTPVQDPVVSARHTHVRWTVCALLFAATSINYMDRQVLGILKPTLQHSINLNDLNYGYVTAAFSAAYAIGLLLSGRLIDKFGTRIGYVMVMGTWSLAAMSHALVSTALGFGIARFFLGLGESGNFPAAIKTVSEWFPQKERSLATGIFNSGSNIGAILAPALVPIITIRYGWHYAFLFTGIFSMLWMIWWFFRYRRPEENPRISPQELAYIRSGSVQTVGKPMPWRELFRYRQLWAFAIAKGLTDPIWWFYLYFLPSFFASQFHLDLKKLGPPLIIVYTVSAVGSIGGGWLPSIFHRFGAPIVKARMMAMLLCACCALPMLATAHVQSEWIAVALLALATAAHQGWSANAFTTASDMFPSRAVGTVVSLGTMAGSLASIALQITAGWILQATGSYTTLFTISASVYLLAWVMLRVLAPGLKPVEPLAST